MESDSVSACTFGDLGLGAHLFVKVSSTRRQQKQSDLIGLWVKLKVTRLHTMIHWAIPIFR